MFSPVLGDLDHAISLVTQVSSHLFEKEITK